MQNNNGKSQKYFYLPSSSSKEIAGKIIDDKKIELLPHKQFWCVNGENGKDYIVRLFREGKYDPTCSCPFTTTCSHILSAMKSIGLHGMSTKKPNVTTMRKNARTNADKKPGTKGGRRLDVMETFLPHVIKISKLEYIK